MYNVSHHQNSVNTIIGFKKIYQTKEKGYRGNLVKMVFVVGEGTGV